MPDLYGWILEQIGRREEVARATEQPSLDWEYDGFVHEVRDLGNGGTVANVYRDGTGAHIVLNDPAAVLRRCTADRRLLTVHGPRGGDWDPNVCEGCGQEGYCQDWVTGHANDCPVLLAVAEGYGLTEEILAGLDRPEPVPRTPAGPSVLGEAVAKMWETALRATLSASAVSRDAFVLSDAAGPGPGEKALQILEPELRTIPLYQPPQDEEPTT